MKKFVASIKLSEELLKKTTGGIGETVFKKWFENNYQNLTIHKSKKQQDFFGVDFSDCDAVKYQVKTAAKISYTFNCLPEDIEEHLTSDYYVFIQLKEGYAFIEGIYPRADVLKMYIRNSQYNGECWIKTKDLYQEVLNI